MAGDLSSSIRRWESSATFFLYYAAGLVFDAPGRMTAIASTKPTHG